MKRVKFEQRHRRKRENFEERTKSRWYAFVDF